MPIVQSLAVLLSFLSAGVFLLVGWAIQRRDVSPAMRIGQKAFVVWWYALAGATLLGALGNLASLELQPLLALTIVTLFILSIGLCGLLFYLVFLFTERRSLLVPMAIGYAGFFAFLTWFILAGDPVGVERTTWGSTIEYANPIDQGPFLVAAIVLLIGPPLVAAGGYLSLYWKVDDPLLKRRILLVSLSILAWFGSSLIGTGTGAAETDAWRLTSRLIGLAAAATIYYAYMGIRPSDPSRASSGKPAADESVYESPPRRGVAHVARLAGPQASPVAQALV
jgi:hypothetical protein